LFDLSQFNNLNSINQVLNSSSRRQVQFTNNLMSIPPNTNLTKIEPLQDGQNVDNDLGTKRKSIELGLPLFSSRRSYGFGPIRTSLRTQSNKLLSKLGSPFKFKTTKKKTKREPSDTLTTLSSNDSKRSNNSNDSKTHDTDNLSRSATPESDGKPRSSGQANGVLNFEGGKHYSRIENVVLVGEIYTQLFVNPALKKKTWVIIAKNFEKFFNDNPSQQQTCIRTSGALERHFKVLKEQNRKEGGSMFAEMYEEYKNLKIKE